VQPITRSPRVMPVSARIEIQVSAWRFVILAIMCRDMLGRHTVSTSSRTFQMLPSVRICALGATRRIAGIPMQFWAEPENATLITEAHSAILPTWWTT